MPDHKHRGPKPYALKALWGVAILLLSLCGCRMLPIDGPLASDVNNELALRQRVPFQLVRLAPDMVSILEESPTEIETFITDLGPSEPHIGPGDGLMITIVEPSAGGLFSGPPSINNTGAEPGARVVGLQEATVGPDGRISVPFAGSVQVGGLTFVGAADRIRAALSGQAVGLQVMVNAVRSVASRVTVAGAVKMPGILPVQPGGETLLEILARAGGAADAPENVVIQLNRFGNVHRIRLQTLLERPETNIHVRPGDYLHCLIQPRSYVVMGATERVDTRNLGMDKLRLTSALASAGGLVDSRADADSVMLFRNEPAAVMDRIAAVQARLARARGEDVPIPPETAPRNPADAPIPVIFMINMRSASGLFMGRQLSIREDDLIYTPNSNYTQVQKFLDLIRLTAGPVAAAAIANKTF